MLSRWIVAATISLVICSAYAEYGFLLTAPSRLQVGHEERMCISFHGFEGAPTVDFQIRVELRNSAEKLDEQVFRIQSLSKCFFYGVPESFSTFGDQQQMTLAVSGRTASDDYTFFEEKEIFIAKPKLITFIQTDKPKYKPGQTVKLRVLSVNEKLIPQLEKIQSIEIIDSNDIKIMVWSNVSVTETQGIADLELELSNEPTLGKWTVDVVVNEHSPVESGFFAVEEYVLPKYEITVNTKSYVSIIDEKIEGEICAMYTYGEPVRGTLRAKFCIVTRDSWSSRLQRPCVFMNATEIEGCQDFSILTEELQMTNGTFSIWRSEFEVFAQITETATGVILNKTHGGIEVTQSIFDMKFLESSPTYYKPGLPYFGRLKVENPDGSPAGGERVSIEFHEYSHNKHFTKVATTNAAGLISFSLPPIETYITSLSLQANLLGYDFSYKRSVHTPNEVRAYNRLKQWYSPTNSYVQIQPIEDAVACDSDVILNISHTTEQEGFVDLFYQVIAHGNILNQGFVRNSFTEGVLAGADESFQEQTCPEGQIYSTCVSRPFTCDNYDRPYDWSGNYPCRSGCYCPYPNNILHEGRCISFDMCPGNEGMMNETVPVCPPGQRFESCGSACEETCDDTAFLCTMQCVARCTCPRGRPVLHDGLCIHRSECPSELAITKPDRSEVRPIVSFDHRLRVDASMAPLMKVLVYYVRADGETVADSIAINVQQCTRNKVEIEFMDAEKYPGETTTLRLKADPESLCSVGVVDKSVHILGGKNRLTLGQVMAELDQYTLNEHSLAEDENEYCRRILSEKAQSTPDPFNRNRRRDRQNRRQNRRLRRSIVWPGMYISNFFDSMKAFRSNGLTVWSDFDINSRPCEKRRPMRRMYYSSVPVRKTGLPGAPDAVANNEVELEPASPEEPTKATLDIRTYFPETWLWDLHLVGRSGEKEVLTELPHTVTSWVGGGFCTNLDSGIGVSADTSIKGFQPFFVSLTMPYSLIRNEIINLPVTVFNYLSECLNVRLSIDDSAELDMDGDSVKETCVCGQETSTQYFRFAPNTLGNVNVTIRAVSVENNGICGNRIFATDQVGVSDAVVRSLLVEAEGEPQEYSRTSFICPETGDMYVEEIMLDMPQDVVPDTPTAMVKVIGDLMGPALDDIDKLLAMPTGCGEQNMLKFAPNIFVMQYLETVNEVTPDIETKSKKFLETGYQRELNYRHDDGSYSAFGNSDASGSMWLTAFVLKSFAQAMPLIYIDKANLQTSIDWVLTQQLENGCFPKVGRVLHKDMKGGLGDGDNPATLTAFVLISLLESKAYIPIPEPAIQSALQCLENHGSSDMYTIALIAYAYSLYDVTSPERATVMEHMETLAQREGDGKYWTAGTNAPTPSPYSYGVDMAKAIDIEMTAYMLLAYTAPGAPNAIDNGLGVVYWLTKQRSAGGGFSSTQDTVIALQALARYQALAFTDTMDLSVMVSGENNMLQQFSVDSTNKMMMQKAVVAMPNKLQVQVNGTGCVFLQTSVRYNMLEKPVVEPAFSLHTQVRRVSSTEGCKRRELKVCASYLHADGYSNMAVISVKMVSGWIPDKDSIKMLLNSVELNLKRFEIEPNLVNFYFDEITKMETCLDFHVLQNVVVDDTKPGYVEVYDYYEIEKKISMPYEIANICGTKQELPDLTQEEYNAILELDENDPSRIEQRRVPDVLPDFNAQPRGMEEPIVPEVAVPLGQGDLGPPAQCPVCYDATVDQATLNDLVCDSAFAYKAAVRHGRYQAKLMANMRSGHKVVMEEFTNFEMPASCECPVIANSARNTKILVLQPRDSPYQTSTKTVQLSSSSHVMPSPSSDRLILRADCPSQP